MEPAPRGAVVDEAGEWAADAVEAAAEAGRRMLAPADSACARRAASERLISAACRATV